MHTKTNAVGRARPASATTRAQAYRVTEAVLNTADPLTLEREADRLIRETRAHQGEYPAYSESDLRRKAKLRGEVCISNLGAGLRHAGRGGEDGSPPDPFYNGVRLCDPENPSGSHSRVKPGYDILLLLLAYASDLTSRERAIVEFTMAGLTLRQIAQQIGVSVWSSSRDLNAAISVIRRRREELEKDYDLERTAKTLHLQTIHLPAPGHSFRSLPLSAHSSYAEEVERLMLGAVKPTLVPAERRCRYDKLSLKRLARELPRSGYRPSVSHRGGPPDVPAMTS